MRSQAHSLITQVLVALLVQGCAAFPVARCGPEPDRYTMRASYGQFLSINQYDGERVKQRRDIGWFNVNNDVRFVQEGATVCDTDAPLFDELGDQLRDMPPHYILFPEERPGEITIDGLTRLRDRVLAVSDRIIQRGVPVSDGIRFCDVGACIQLNGYDDDRMAFTRQVIEVPETNLTLDELGQPTGTALSHLLIFAAFLKAYPDMAGIKVSVPYRTGDPVPQEDVIMWKVLRVRTELESRGVDMTHHDIFYAWPGSPMPRVYGRFDRTERAILDDCRSSSPTEPIMAPQQWEEPDESYEARYLRHLLQMGRYLRQKYHYQLCTPESAPPPCNLEQRSPVPPGKTEPHVPQRGAKESDGDYAQRYKTYLSALTRYLDEYLVYERERRHHTACHPLVPERAPSNSEPESSSSISPPPVVVEQDSIRIVERIQFQFDSATLLSASFPILDAVAAAMREHKEIQLVRIDGHTDDVGTTAYNLRLSEDRAFAVRRYLIRVGIAEDRLSIHGFGQLVPLPAMPNESADEHRTRNRRVEFTIVRRQ